MLVKMIRNSRNQIIDKLRGNIMRLAQVNKTTQERQRNYYNS
jgi:hypothetical protein